MKFNSMVKDYLRRAMSRLIDAESALRRGDHPEVVRYSQESVELTLKACLRAVAIEYPKVHDVGDVLKANERKFPEWFRMEIEVLTEISRDLAEKRAPSMYGIEVLGKTPSQIFGEKEAIDALNKARFVHKIAVKFIEEFYGNKLNIYKLFTT